VGLSRGANYPHTVRGDRLTSGLTAISRWVAGTSEGTVMRELRAGGLAVSGSISGPPWRAG
jgi:hypothetical protein